MNLIRKALAAIRAHWRSLRLQLALLYGGAFVALGAALLAVSGLLVRSASQSVTGGSTSQNFFSGRQVNIGPALVFLSAVLVAVTLGWLIAGRSLRPLRTITSAARDISASNLSRRLSITGRDDEFTALGETLDDLFGGWRRRSRRSGISSPTPRMSCAPRSPRNGPCCSSRSPIPTSPW